MKKEIQIFRVALLLAILVPLICCDYTGLPLIGVVSVPAPKMLNNEFYNAQTYWSLIPKSYTSYIGQTGAMPLLIPYDVPLETMDHLLEQVSGIHFIGGGAPFFTKDGKPTFWLTRVNHIMKKAKEFNDKGRFFPILGTSLGMESMVISMTGNNKQVISCNYDDHETNHTIQKTSEFSKSKFWGKIDSDLVDKAFSNGYLYYSHICGFDPIKLANDPAFQKEGIITGTSISKNGKKFVAMVEHKSYPFIALQWHPEKTQFERLGPTWLSRDPETTKFTSELIMTFVDQVRGIAKSLAEFDGATRAFFEVYHIPERPAWEDFEQIYTFQQYSVFSSQAIEGLLYEKAEDLTIKRKLKKLNDILFKDEQQFLSQQEELNKRAEAS